MKVYFILLIILIAGCTQSSISDTNDYPAEYSDDYPEYDGYDESYSQGQENNEFPIISTRISPTDVGREEEFELTISAEDDYGIDKLNFESSHIFWNHEKEGSYECNGEKTCSHTWELITWEEGVYEIIAYVVDTGGLESGRVPLEVNVGPYRVTTTTVPMSVEVETTTTLVDTSDECSSNSDCGYKQKCKNGKCQTVECTTDSHCSGCRRCSSNSCVSCGSGPYGCYC